jgi:hypothetical protein
MKVAEPGMFQNGWIFPAQFLNRPWRGGGSGLPFGQPTMNSLPGTLPGTGPNVLSSLPGTLLQAGGAGMSALSPLAGTQGGLPQRLQMLLYFLNNALTARQARAADQAIRKSVDQATRHQKPPSKWPLIQLLVGLVSKRLHGPLRCPSPSDLVRRSAAASPAEILKGMSVASFTLACRPSSNACNPGS